MRLVDQVKARLHPLVARGRRTLRRWVHPLPMTAPLDEESFRATLELVAASATVEEGGPLRSAVRVGNRSPRPWSSRGSAPVRVRATWVDRRRAAVAQAPVSIDLPGPIAPGSDAVVPITMTAIDALGRFGVELEIVQETTGGVVVGTAPSTVLDCTVTARGADDIDYVALYAVTDLEQDHWAIVGPQQRNEFDRLGDVKLRQLVEQGLTPRSRLLDVGCGTGLLAAAAKGFLDDDGVYVGTDIGAEAIAYCRRTYRRANFRFTVGEMTSIPLAGELFDAVCFYSVFTHTYPDETALLLAEAKRLLAPEGFVIADVFTSPMVERAAGNRGAVENEPEHLARLVELVGLRSEVIETGPWRRFGERRFYRLTHG